MMKLFHAGYEEITVPDIHRGRVNADFGQGFYLSDNHEFVSRWVREKSDSVIYINSYELDDSGLKVKSFEETASGSDMSFPTEGLCLMNYLIWT